MRESSISWRVIAGIVCCFWCVGVACCSGVMARATVRDGIGMTSLAFDGYLIGGLPCGSGTDHESVETLSPQGGRFVVVVKRGNVRNMVNQYMMLLWKHGASGLMGPLRILKMSSSTYHPGINPATVTWSRNGRSITFLGARGDGHEEIYRFDLTSRTLKVLTRSKSSIISFSIDSAGTAWAYGAVGAAESLWNRSTLAHGLPVTTQSMSTVLFGEAKEPWAEQFSTLFVANGKESRKIQPLAGSHFDYQQIGGYALSVSMSPNGRYVVVPESVPYGKIPKIWRRYTDPGVRMSLSALGTAERHKNEDIVLFSRLVLVDVRNGHSRILLNVPFVGASRPLVWAPNSRSVIVSHTMLPIGVGGVNAWKADSVQQTVEVDIRNGAVTPIGRQCTAALRWHKGALKCMGAILSADRQVGRRLARIRAQRAKRRVCAARENIYFKVAKNGSWHAVTGEEVAPLEVFLKEGRNAPPELYYRRKSDARARVLWNLNPQLRHVALARERLVTWQWSKGHSITGGLYYPPSYQRDRRYPLVIQTHGFDPGLFAYWGAYPSSDAAQPLAARGIFVLQVNDTSLRLQEKPENGQLEEVRRAVKIYRTAIAYLAGKGLIDPRRVGIIGFSHTCFFVDWALTHDPHLFAAASVTEGGDGSPMQYMLSMMGSVITQSLYGGPPFGRTLKNWVKRAPIFHVNRVRTPLLLVIPHPKVTTLFEWEWLHGLRELRKPVQMLVLDGRIKDLHTMQVPMSIAVASGESVDWFDFWLNGQEPRGPATRSEYRHWERLCAEQKRENPGRPVYCVTSSPRDRGTHHGRSAVS